MPNYECDNCNKIFKRNENLKYHIANNACKIDSVFCKYCKKGFTSSISMNRHVRLYCKVKKKDDDNKKEIFDRLVKLEEKNRVLEEKNKVLEEELNKIKKQTKISHKTLNKNNGLINNGTFVNNNNINLVAYGSEDMTKLDKKEILRVLRKGYDSTIRLTETLHFNPKYPEYHNIYITNMRDKYAMMYDGKCWELTIKEDLLNRIYDDKKNYIEDNVEDFVDSLSKSQKNALERWANTDEDDKKIRQLKERIKLLLYNLREIPINTQKNIDGNKILLENNNNHATQI